MTSETPKGREPAFPYVVGTFRDHASPGMTLRDYFAAAALTGLLARGQGSTLVTYARECYQLADAMLEAREASHG